MRVKHTLLLTVAEDAELKSLLFERDSNLDQVILDGFDRVASGLLQINGGITESLSFGDVAAVKGLYLRVDQDLTVVKINGSADPITLTKQTADSFAKLFMEATLSAVTITAPAGLDVTGIYCVWGDPTTP